MRIRNLRTTGLGGIPYSQLRRTFRELLEDHPELSSTESNRFIRRYSSPEFSGLYPEEALNQMLTEREPEYKTYDDVLCRPPRSALSKSADPVMQSIVRQINLEPNQEHDPRECWNRLDTDLCLGNWFLDQHLKNRISFSSCSQVEIPASSLHKDLYPEVEPDILCARVADGEQIHSDLVSNLTKEFKQNRTFDPDPLYEPIHLWQYEGKFLVRDGWHRLEALRETGWRNSKVRCWVATVGAETDFAQLRYGMELTYVRNYSRWGTHPILRNVAFLILLKEYYCRYTLAYGYVPSEHDLAVGLRSWYPEVLSSKYIRGALREVAKAYAVDLPQLLNNEDFSMPGSDRAFRFSEGRVLDCPKLYDFLLGRTGQVNLFPAFKSLNKLVDKRPRKGGLVHDNAVQTEIQSDSQAAQQMTLETVECPNCKFRFLPPATQSPENRFEVARSPRVV